VPRRRLHLTSGLVLHVLNRAVRRAQLFTTWQDYLAFEAVVSEALHRYPTRLLAYCVMPNHWHMVLWPLDNELPQLMHWLTLTHAKRWHAAHGSTSTGPVYQNRYGAIPVQTDAHLLRLLRYVERNALRAGLVSRAEEWRWGSLWACVNSCTPVPLSPWPILKPDGWVQTVNEAQSPTELEAIRSSIRRLKPFGTAEWRQAMTSELAREDSPDVSLQEDN
jgi:putative transposase